MHGVVTHDKIIIISSHRAAACQHRAVPSAHFHTGRPTAWAYVPIIFSVRTDVAVRLANVD